MKLLILINCYVFKSVQRFCDFENYHGILLGLPKKFSVTRTISNSNLSQAGPLSIYSFLTYLPLLLRKMQFALFKKFFKDTSNLKKKKFFSIFLVKIQSKGMKNFKILIFSSNKHRYRILPAQKNVFLNIQSEGNFLALKFQ